MEIFWLSLGVILLFVLGFMICKSGFEWSYALIGILPFAMFFARRFMRKKLEQKK